MEDSKYGGSLSFQDSQDKPCTLEQLVHQPSQLQCNQSEMNQTQKGKFLNPKK